MNRKPQVADEPLVVEEGSGEPGSAPRRGFLAGIGAAAAAGLALVAPLWSGVRVALDPLGRSSGEADLIPVAKLAAIPDDGVPHKFRVVTDRVDAWNTHRQLPVGAVYLRRSGDSVEALNVVCPHAGCFVNIAADRSRFVCPCHKSSFDLSGAVNDPASPSPRDMDTLDVEIRGDDVWVRFQNFLPGRAEKEPVA